VEVSEVSPSVTLAAGGVAEARILRDVYLIGQKGEERDNWTEQAERGKGDYRKEWLYRKGDQ